MPIMGGHIQAHNGDSTTFIIHLLQLPGHPRRKEARTYNASLLLRLTNSNDNKRPSQFTFHYKFENPKGCPHSYRKIDTICYFRNPNHFWAIMVVS